MKNQNDSVWFITICRLQLSHLLNTKRIKDEEEALSLYSLRIYSSSSDMAPEPENDIKDDKNPRPLDEGDIALLKTYVSLTSYFLLNVLVLPFCTNSDYKLSSLFH